MTDAQQSLGSELREALAWVVLVAFSISLAVAIAIGGGTACSTWVAYNAKNEREQVRDNAARDFYKFCKRKLSVGQVYPGCPR